MWGDRTAKLILLVASAGVLIGAAATVQRVLNFPNLVWTSWDHLLINFCPTLVLFTAAWLSRYDHTPARYAVLVAALIVVAYRGFDLGLTLYTEGAGAQFRNNQWLWRFYTFTCYAPVLLAVTAFVPAVVGWWQRRQDRLAEADD